MFKNHLAVAIAATFLPLSPLFAHNPIAAQSASIESTKYQADRQSILAMAGTFRVKFDFNETTAWQPDYVPIAPKPSGGHEVVRVIEDTGRTIVLQHILVVTVEGKPMIVKHWRQDWAYEPASVLVYTGPNQWKLETVPSAMRKGRWSQTVWQTDDSPRYGGWGEWSSEGGVPRWRSNWSWRPLARRDAVKHPAYDRYYAINRHSPTPTGWIHWQDNLKMGMKDGKLVPFVQEAGLNTYTRDTTFDFAIADAYWAKSKDYWAAVRAAWSAVIVRDGGIAVTEYAEAGSVIAERLMTLADDIEAGRIDTAKASIEAKKLIETTRTSDVPVKS